MDPDNRIHEFDHYQELTRETAIGYSQSGDGVTREEAIHFLGLGVAGESGELVEKIKKYKREDDPVYLAMAESEIGDVLWYLARLCDEIDVDLSEVADDNVAKLLDRADRDQITGQGDDR